MNRYRLECRKRFVACVAVACLLVAGRMATAAPPDAQVAVKDSGGKTPDANPLPSAAPVTVAAGEVPGAPLEGVPARPVGAAAPDGGSSSLDGGEDAGNPSTGSDSTVHDTESPRLAFVYVLLVFLFPLLLLGGDVIYAHRSANTMREELLTKVSALSGDQVKALASQMTKSMPAVSGLSRSTIAVTLLLILGIAVVHIVALDPHGMHTDLLKNVLMLLAGAVTSITGFYYGNKAATDSKESSPPPRPPAPPTKQDGSITVVVPRNAPRGAKVTIAGNGFGTQGGTISFDKVVAKTLSSWDDAFIDVAVPDLPAGANKVRITVNPLAGAAIESTGDLFTVDPPIPPPPKV